MSKSRTIELDGVGPVLLERSTRARHLSIKIQLYKGIRVVVPRRASFKQAEQFVHSKIGWIRKHRERINRLELEYAEAKKNVSPINRKEAREELVKRLDELAREHGFTYNRVFIRQQKTRWGSCSSRNNINLNVKLVRLPEYLRDYVIIHELVHTKHRHHKNRFWTAMDKILGDARALRTELNRHRIELL